MKLTIDFQVELDNPEDKKLLATVKRLKKHHKFVPTLRDALRLILDLRSGSTVVLFELFPGLMGQGAISSTSLDTTELDKKIARLEELALIISDSKYQMQGYEMQSAQPLSGHKPDTAGQGKPAPAPVMKAAAVASADSIADAFLSSFM